MIHDNGTWDQYSAEDVYNGSSYYTFEAEILTLQNIDLDPFLSLTISGDQLADEGGDTLSRYVLPAPQLFFPAAENSLNEAVTFT